MAADGEARSQFAWFRKVVTPPDSREPSRNVSPPESGSLSRDASPPESRVVSPPAARPPPVDAEEEYKERGPTLKSPGSVDKAISSVHVLPKMPSKGPRADAIPHKLEFFGLQIGSSISTPWAVSDGSEDEFEEEDGEVRSPLPPPPVPQNTPVTPYPPHRLGDDMDDGDDNGGVAGKPGSPAAGAGVGPEAEGQTEGKRKKKKRKCATCNVL